MSDKIKDFLDILELEESTQISVQTTTVDKVNVQPLSFKQQKNLVTVGVNGIAGIMSFIKNLNDVIINNSGVDNFKIYDRIPVALALRKALTNNKIQREEGEVDIEDLIAQFKKYNGPETDVIDCGEYQIHLQVPTLKQENKILNSCIEDLKQAGDIDLGKNISLILSYEIPKFVEKITFGSKTVTMDELTTFERKKIIDKIPANITNSISEFIIKVRAYDEELLTVNGVTVGIDPEFFV